MKEREVEQIDIKFIKGREKFIFIYAIGREAELIKQFTRMAENLDLNFDFYDANVLTRQVRNKMTEYYKKLFEI